MGWCRVIATWPRGLLWQGLALPTRAALAWSQHPAGIGASCCGRRGFSQLLPARSRAGSDLPLINQEPKQNRQLCQRQLCRQAPNSSGLTAASSFFCIGQESFKSNTAQRTALVSSRLPITERFGLSTPLPHGIYHSAALFNREAENCQMFYRLWQSGHDTC